MVFLLIIDVFNHGLAVFFCKRSGVILATPTVRLGYLSRCSFIHKLLRRFISPTNGANAIME